MEHLGQAEMAARMQEDERAVLAGGFALPGDLGGTAGTAEVAAAVLGQLG